MGVSDQLTLPSSCGKRHTSIEVELLTSVTRKKWSGRQVFYMQEELVQKSSHVRSGFVATTSSKRGGALTFREHVQFLILNLLIRGNLLITAKSPNCR